jgi:hypothetical protein
MTKHDLNRPALGKEPEAKKDEPEKSEAKPVRFRLGPLEIEGPLKVGVSILISLIVGAVSTLLSITNSPGSLLNL